MNTIDNTQRRTWLKQAMAACGLALTPAAVWAALDKSSLADNPFFTLICDLVIPDTSVPGAVKAGVPDFITLAATHGMKGAKAEQITGFEALLNQHSGSVFVSLKEQEQKAALTALDAAAFSHPRGVPMPEVLAAWKALKALIVVGYFTSEIGASQALRYVLVPGRFNPDVPLSDNPKAFSTDWTGVKYA